MLMRDGMTRARKRIPPCGFILVVVQDFLLLFTWARDFLGILDGARESWTRSAISNGT